MNEEIHDNQQIHPDIDIGSLWWDKYNKWNGDVDLMYLVMSADEDKGKYYYECAEFMYVEGKGYCGANIRKFLASEILQMKEIGKLPRIPIRIKKRKLFRRIDKWMNR